MAQSLATSFISQGFTATVGGAGGNVVTVYANSTGLSSDYAFAIPFCYAGCTNDFLISAPNTAFATDASGNEYYEGNFSGGINAGTYYDTGTLTAQVSGTQVQVPWGQGSTVSGLASSLAAAINSAAGDFVSATVSGSGGTAKIWLNSLSGGPETDYSVTASATDTTNPLYYVGTSFTVGDTNMAGGAISSGNANAITPYIAVNGVWSATPENTVTVPSGSSVSLGPWPNNNTGSWSWTGPNGFASTAREIDNIPLIAGNNTFVATYILNGVSSAVTFVISIPTAITPYIQVNGGPWQAGAGATVASGAAVNLGPWPLVASACTWSWAGPNGFTSTAREIDNIPLVLGDNTFVATYTLDGVSSTLPFVIAVTGATPPAIVPYIALNGVWNSTPESAVTVPAGTAVSLGPWPIPGGIWSWTGPDGFTASTREIDAIPLSAGVNAYLATYTLGGVTNTQEFLITVTPAPGYGNMFYSYLIPDQGGYAPNGNLMNVTDSVTGAWSYTYDNLNRLLGAAAASSVAPGTQSYFAGAQTGWGYDAFGNRRNETQSGKPAAAMAGGPVIAPEEPQ